MYYLKTMLDYKAKRLSVMYLEVNEAYSTQTCSSCGCIGDNSPKGLSGLNKRNWECSECGTSLNRDENAATNILRKGHFALDQGIPCL